MATTLTPGSTDGTLNGTSDVDLVPAPGPGVQRLVKLITVSNMDSAPVVLIVMLEHASGQRTIWKGTLQVGDTWQCGEGDVMVLDATDKAVVAKLAGAAASSNPDFTASWSDKGTA